ncbi:ShlB/FhaC/HecB family hemolysin secretion/activation protein [Candidatus Parabeggiatoa sp. HSG14]|uniref:ShlB/FhaC/HecB family hemolysin secretion/activation protein n=1 Tax=Candidatus Parabeggiatoa sp. HSG14 TaxID=3055593 RepID=UPI0025A831EE|nr:ShlB/FhaC/HecB family hemolysin secretion/activation protein [Thiotrichales bacterium HSG14]
MQDKQYYLSFLSRRIGEVLGITLLLALLSSHLLAADPGIDRMDRESLNSDMLGEDESSPVLPPLPDLPPIPLNNAPLSSVANITVNQFEFEGNKEFTDKELISITQDYIGKEISAEQLQEVKNLITRRYIEKGYINSGAIIPDQKVDDNVVKIKIIEGRLLEVDVTGNESLRKAYVKERLESEKGKALNINELQDRLQLLQQNPRFDRINAELGPGVKLGEGILKIDVKEARPYHFGFKFNNHRSPSVGAYRGEIDFSHNNLTGLFGNQKGWGDTFYLRYGMTEGLKDYSLRYDFPLNRNDTTLSFHVERSDSDVVESPFNLLDVESEADTYAVTITHPLLKKPQESFGVAVRFEKRSSKTFLLGKPFSFSPGVRDGESDLAVIRFSQDWLNRSRTHVLAARSSFNVGVNALESTINEDGTPDSQFFSWLGQFQWVQRLDNVFKDIDILKNSQTVFRTDLQWADQDLLPLEKFSVGGASTVRGYRENYLTRDRGLVSSLEWRIPLPKSMNVPLPWISKNPEDGRIEFAPFVDYGRSWNADSETPGFKDIYSIGLGLRWTAIQDHVYAEVYWGKALRDIPDPEDEDLQDDGVHFEMRLQY